MRPAPAVPSTWAAPWVPTTATPPQRWPPGSSWPSRIAWRLPSASLSRWWRPSQPRCHARCSDDYGRRFLANLWQIAVRSAPSMQEAGCWTRPELLVCGGAPRRNRTGDPILTMNRRPSAVLTRVFAARPTPWGHSYGVSWRRPSWPLAVVGAPRLRSGEASAGPPEAEPGEQDGDGDKDAGFGPLEGPEVVGGVVGEVLAQAEAADPVGAHLGGGVGPAVLRVGGSGEDLAGG